MLYRISVAERGLTDIGNIFRSRLSGLDDPLRAGTVPLKANKIMSKILLTYHCVTISPTGTKRKLK